jgi:hypothetical protein
VTRSNQYHVTNATRYQARPPKQIGAHEYLAEIGVCLDDGHQVFMIDLDDLTPLAHTDREDRASPRERIDLTAHLPRPMNYYYRLDIVGYAHDFQFSCDHNEETRVAGARPYQDLTALDLTCAAVGSDARNLRGRKRRKCLIFRWQPRRRQSGNRIPRSRFDRRRR